MHSYVSNVGFHRDSSKNSTRRSKEKPLKRKLNAAHRKCSKSVDQLIPKAVELKVCNWWAILAFLKRNWEVLREQEELYRSCDIGDRRSHDRLRKQATTLLGKRKSR